MTAIRSATIFLAVFFLSTVLGRSFLPEAVVPAPCHAASTSRPEILELTVTNSDKRLLANLTFLNGCTSDVIHALESGIPVSFIYEFELKMPRRFFKDKTIANRTVVKTMTYDNLKKEYRISFGSRKPRVISVKTMEEAERIAFKMDKTSITPLTNLPRGRIYTLKARVGTRKTTSSLPFSRLMNVFSSWGFTTEWYEIRFTY
ncbi:MAG TPA: DUF4390 domain-containing protein [Thermodesulfobacteriaceae bacterium]|nr:DUF4390 domain-containing protein [Thermodesulfobacteriaceae bacterium]